MANAFKISNAAAIAMADEFLVQMDIGSTAAVITIWDDTGTVPTEVDAGHNTNVKLATLTCTDPVSGAASDGAPGGLLTFSAITEDSSADATGTAAYFFIEASGAGADDVAMGNVATSGADLNLNSIAITAGSAVAITSMTVTMPEA